MTGPKWFLNASKYGHADFFDAQYRDLADLICTTCKKECEFSKYRVFVKEIILSFLDGIFNKNDIALKIIENASFAIPAAHKHDYMGYNPLQGAFCKHIQDSKPTPFNL